MKTIIRILDWLYVITITFFFAFLLWIACSGTLNRLPCANKYKIGVQGQRVELMTYYVCPDRDFYDDLIAAGAASVRRQWPDYLIVVVWDQFTIQQVEMVLREWEMKQSIRK